MTTAADLLQLRRHLPLPRCLPSLTPSVCCCPHARIHAARRLALRLGLALDPTRSLLRPLAHDVYEPAAAPM
jgi:hypothetical protein